MNIIKTIETKINASQPATNVIERGVFDLYGYLITTLAPLSKNEQLENLRRVRKNINRKIDDLYIRRENAYSIGDGENDIEFKDLSIELDCFEAQLIIIDEIFETQFVQDIAS